MIDRKKTVESLVEIMEKAEADGAPPSVIVVFLKDGTEWRLIVEACDGVPDSHLILVPKEED